MVFHTADGTAYLVYTVGSTAWSHSAVLRDVDGMVRRAVDGTVSHTVGGTVRRSVGGIIGTEPRTVHGTLPRKMVSATRVAVCLRSCARCD